MGVSRSTVVDRLESGVYHCISRCVRRAYLCGWDKLTGKSFEHRRAWIADRIRELSKIFGVEILAYAVMSNHLHLVIRTRPDVVKGWDAEQVASRWCQLFPKRNDQGNALPPDELYLKRLEQDAERLGVCRDRLSDLSWFMRCLNEPIARRSNREDDCTGRFWEGRFKCQRLLDEGAILACMAYVDLNPVRAGLAQTLEESDFTSVQDRLVTEQAREREAVGDQAPPTTSQQCLVPKKEPRAAWLADLNDPKGALSGVGLETYLTLVEWTGRHIREDKPGYLPVGLEPVLDRFALDKEAWVQNVARYGSLFSRMAGRLEHLVARAIKAKQSWFQGHRGSRQLYCPPQPQT